MLMTSTVFLAQRGLSIKHFKKLLAFPLVSLLQGKGDRSLWGLVKGYNKKVSL